MAALRTCGTAGKSMRLANVYHFNNCAKSVSPEAFKV